MNRWRYKIAERLVGLANALVWSHNSPGYNPKFRPIDTSMPGIGTKHSCSAYSYEGLKSLVEQDGPDGFGATATVAWLLSEDGWEDITPENAERITAEINRSFTLEATKQEQERLNEQ